MSRTSKMMQYVNWRMRVVISDTRTLLGTFMAYDKHMNIVLGDTEEYRIIKSKKGGEDREVKRTLGLVLLRGENVIAMSTESPPAPRSRAELAAVRTSGPGVGKPAGRGMPVAPLSAAPRGLQGPVKGLGGPGAAMMMPQAGRGRGAMTGAAPVAYPPRPPGGMPGMPGMPPMPPSGMPPMGMPPMGMPPMMMGRGMPPRPGMPGMPFGGAPPFMGRGGPPMFMGRGGPPGGFPGPPGQ